MTARKAASAVARPKTVKVGWATFRINYISDADWIADDTKSNEDGGNCYGGTLDINVRMFDGAHEDALKEIVVHEIVHAIFHVTATSVNLYHPKRIELEEFITGSLSGPLLAVMRENPKVLAYLIDA